MESAEERAARLAEEERARQAAIEAERIRNEQAVQAVAESGQLKTEQPAIDTSTSDQKTVGQTKSVQQSSGSSVGASSQTGTSTSNQSSESSSTSYREITPEAQAAGQAAHDEYMTQQGYVKDPNGNWVLNKTLFDVLNIPREKMRKERERQEKHNRMKQLAAGIYHGAELLTDSISLGTGGRVWKRDKDDTASKAADENKQLRTLQLAEDAAFADKQRKDLQNALDRAQQIGEQRTRDLMRTVSNQNSNSRGTQTSTSNSIHRQAQSNTIVGTQTSKQGTFFNDDFVNRRYGRLYGSGGGGAGKYKTVKIPYTGSDGVQHSYDIDIPEAHYEAMGRYISSTINQLRKSGKNVDAVLKAAGITPQKSGKEKGTYNTDDILAGGIIFDSKEFREEFEKVIMSSDELSPEGKMALIQSMKTYPVQASEPQKKSWWKRLWEKITGKDEQPTTGWKPSGNSNESDLL